MGLNATSRGDRIALSVIGVVGATALVLGLTLDDPPAWILVPIVPIFAAAFIYLRYRMAVRGRGPRD